MVLAVLGAFLLANADALPHSSGSSFGLNLTRSHIALLPSCTAAVRCHTYAALLMREVERRAPGVRWEIKPTGTRLSPAITLAIQDPPAHISSPAPEEGYSITSSPAVTLKLPCPTVRHYPRVLDLHARLACRWGSSHLFWPMPSPPRSASLRGWVMGLGRASTSLASASAGFSSASVDCCVSSTRPKLKATRLLLS